RLLGVAGYDKAVVDNGDGTALRAAAAGAAERQRDVDRIPAAECEPQGAAAVAARAANRLGKDAVGEVANGTDDRRARRRDVDRAGAAAATAGAANCDGGRQAAAAVGGVDRAVEIAGEASGAA